LTGAVEGNVYEGGDADVDAEVEDTDGWEFGEFEDIG